jgi:hypothetical protein
MENLVKRFSLSNLLLVKRKVMNKKRYRLKKVLYGVEQASQA